MNKPHFPRDAGDNVKETWPYLSLKTSQHLLVITFCLYSVGFVLGQSVTYVCVSVWARNVHMQL